MQEKQKELQSTIKKTHRQKISELDLLIVYNLIQEKQMTIGDFEIWCQELEDKHHIDKIQNQ